MLASFESIWSQVYDTLSWVPDGVVTALMFAAAIAAALLIDRVADAVLRRAFAVGHPFLYSLLMRLEGPMRLALVLFALNLAAATVPLDRDVASAFGYPLRIAFIAMIGWMALSAM